ncbi:glycosyltransferase family 4 protein [Isoptericola sp. NPDC055881]
MTRLMHVLTPGDHYSPRTGSAVPTVVHGLCVGAPAGTPRPVVVVASGTYADRYDSAVVVEYAQAPEPGRWDRRLDVLRALALRPRSTRRPWAAALADQQAWEPSTVVLHNAPQAVPLVDRRRHSAVLYAHNMLLRSYSRAEAGRTLDQVDAIVCVSEFLAEATRARLPRSLRDRVHVVRNGVDPGRFRPAPRLDRGRLEVVFAGRTIPAKGPEVLLRAALLLDRPDVHVTVVGSSGFSATDPLTPYEVRLRDLAGRLGTRATLRPFAARADVAALMAAADVVVVPSVWPEPFALTVLEGMAAGAAVVASAVGGIPEAVEDGGVLVPPGDAEALASVLGRWADDRAALGADRARAQRRAARRDWSVVAAELERVVTTSTARTAGTVTPGPSTRGRTT